ncbi:hypothetical protein [Hahella ganghwensis]|uniref:hypothetical protein n=1 Tax=Hahella ganghwensis TaxID=286420 RepID=UPI00037E9A52|nr:hypothetical protein [Hahella ganghwensis]
MNLILEKTDQVEFYTFMEQVFTALKIACEEFDWYLSDIETNGYNIPEGWISGKELRRILEGNEIQFIWSVFSAFKVGTRFEVAEDPVVHDNPTYWDGSNPAPQLSGAVFEVASWDSSATILIGLDQNLAQNYRAAFSDAKELRNVSTKRVNK